MKLEGVKKVDVDWQKGEVVVEYDLSKATTSQMVKAINDSGVFKVKTAEELSGEKRNHKERSKR